jgi:pSer/pThr/pTyr-binding forkhead associated (FHA) protein
VGGSPLDPHAATASELQERIRADQRGTPFLLYRDGDDRQVVVELATAAGPVTIGRGAGNTIELRWDSRVSRVHAELAPRGEEWVLSDDGLSRNGTLVNGERLTGRRRLRDGDVITICGTTLAYLEPGEALPPTVTGGGATAVGDVLTPAQRRVLEALCRPYRDDAIATPASNADIARALSISVDTVKSTMRALFEVFGIADLPQNAKRASLVRQAMRTGAISRRDL